MERAKSIEETYIKKTQIEHILLRPDTYIGSIERSTQSIWVLDRESKKIINRPCTFVPGLYKIFDEIIVNASDNKQRDPSMNKIEVIINPDENFIKVWNNGTGIPIAIHQEHKIYVPELIFGHLLTGSNFDDEEEKTTGGRNGYGSKLTNIFSTKFIVETADSSRNLKYHQEFSNNMSKTSPPVIKSYKGSDYTSITFFPDLARFKMDKLDEDIVSLLCKRVYDIAGTSTSIGSKLNVHLNNEKLDIRKFEDYLALYQGIEPPVAFAKVNDRWEIGVGISDGSFQQVSFVNSICTSKGGQHVNYIADQIVSKLSTVVKKRNKGEEVKPNQIKNHLAVFVNTLIVNPAFDSQTKENLTTKASAFGSTCIVPDKLFKQIEKSNIIDNILNWAKFKQSAELKKKSGSKRSKILGITKLDDANYAGTSKSDKCTLILTEGDSAKALAISGLGVVGRDFYGVFPLKGKLLNVREASHAQIMKNEEIQNITKILGLTFGKEYADVSSLRYGHLMIMTDQDHDGSHIKGLVINFLHYFWPSLLKIDGFLKQFITPIVKCSKGKNELSFFTIPEYEHWKQLNGDGKGWKIKYYKGLGTSTAAEAKEYFSNLQIHERPFQWNDNSNDFIDLAFAKKRVDDRKSWLLKMEPGIHIDYKVENISYENFVNHELILFSHADNERSIAHFMDGLKPSQRKVLFSCFKRNLKQEIKVAQLAGYISEHSAYHHGEASLTQTIIGMAQNFVGSNNINLLSPCGQFGTRLMGGKDAASPRYVFTKLENITRFIFHPDDDPLLKYLDDDGQSIEPIHYVPIIPMVLVNGSEGIGTGWSSSIPTYNPREIISNLRMMIRGEEPLEMVPWYRGFTGTILGKPGKDNSSFTVTGIIEQLDEQTVRITELPIGKWTTDYKLFLETVSIGNTSVSKDENCTSMTPFIKDFKENHTDTTVLFTISLTEEKIADALKMGLTKKFKLDTSISITNMNLFDENSHVCRYQGPLHILKDFFVVRLNFYHRRKNMLIENISKHLEKLSDQVRFLLAIIKGEFIVANKSKKSILSDLKNHGYRTYYENTKPLYSSPVEKSDEIDIETTEVVSEENTLEKGYDYLLNLKLWNLTLEKVKELIDLRDLKSKELELLKVKSPEDLWLADLDNLEIALEEFEASMDEFKKLEFEANKKASNSQKMRAKRKSPVSTKEPKSKIARKTPPINFIPTLSQDDEIEDCSNEDSDEINEDDDDSDYQEKKSSFVRKSTGSSIDTLISNESKTQTPISKRQITRRVTQDGNKGKITSSSKDIESTPPPKQVPIFDLTLS